VGPNADHPWYGQIDIPGRLDAINRNKELKENLKRKELSSIYF
jgi:hypothetical protein